MTTPATPQPADRATLRDRIAAALYPTYGQEDRNRSLAIADAVLAVLPAPTDRAAVHREAALTDLASHWEQMADHYKTIVGCFEGPTAATLDAEIAERSRTYRNAAADLREVLTTGCIPHDLKAAAVAADPAADEAEATR